jgi:hypothetical protein
VIALKFMAPPFARFLKTEPKFHEKCPERHQETEKYVPDKMKPFFEVRKSMRRLKIYFGRLFGRR